VAFIRKLNQDGHTIVLTTHYLEEAETLCGRIAMLKAGRIVALDTTANLLQRFASHLLQVSWPPRGAAAALAAKVLREADGGLEFGFEHFDDVADILAGVRRRRLHRRHGPRQARHGAGLRRHHEPELRQSMEGFKTLLYKECLRFWKVGFQTVLSPVLTAVLYLLIFGHVLEDHVQPFRASATRPSWCPAW
jgi:hypothetical protein